MIAANTMDDAHQLSRQLLQPWLMGLALYVEYTFLSHEYSARLRKPINFSSINRLFFIAIIFHADGLFKSYAGTAKGGAI
jgi:hypothetical protein